MADDDSQLSTESKKSYLEKPLDPSHFEPLCSSDSDSTSSFSSEELELENHARAVAALEKAYQMAALQSKVVIPFEAFLVGMGVPKSALDVKGNSLKTTASSNDLPQAPETTKVERYEPFCELVNFISELSYKVVVMTWDNPTSRESPCMVRGSLPVVMAVTRQCEHARFVVDFRTYSNMRRANPEIDSFTWPPSEVSPSIRPFGLPENLSDSREDSTEPNHASDHGHSNSSVSSPACVGTCKPVDEDTPVPSISHLNAPIEPEPSTPAALEAFYPPPCGGWGKRRRNETSSKSDEVGKRAKLAKTANDAEEESPFKDLEVDGIRTAIKLMWYFPHRRHVYQLLVADGKLRIAYYDRSGVVFSEGFSYAENARPVALLLQRLTEMRVWEAGFVEDMKGAEGPVEEILDALAPCADMKPAFRRVMDNLEPETPFDTLNFDCNTVVYLVCGLAGRRYGLTGKSTTVWMCYLVSPDKRGIFVLKLSWPQPKRESEVEVLKKARAVLRRVDANPEHKKVYGDRMLEESLPVVMASRDLDDLKREGSFRWTTEEYYEKFEVESNRIYRTIVMEYLRPLHSVTSLDHFKEGIRDVVLAHHFLCISEERIVHRDISANNLMVRYYPGTDKIRGVLIDFDCALVGPPSSVGHSGKPTGTRPFMSTDLLKPVAPIHLERFDWESFFYAICWIGSHYARGYEVRTRAFREWETPSDSSLYNVKIVVLCGSLGGNLRGLFTEFYTPLISLWMRPLQEMFHSGVRARINLEEEKFKLGNDTMVFDEETLGGHVTWDKFWAILQQ